MFVTGDSIDSFHLWPAETLNWTEAVWFGAWAPEHALTVYLYHWFRPAMGIYGGGCIVWIGDTAVPWEAPLFQYDVNRPVLGRLDLRDLTLDNGFRLYVLRPGYDYEMEFRNPRATVALRFTATTAPDLTDRRGTSDLFEGHVDQPGCYSGYVEIDGHRYPIDCFGIRDRSWGPREIGDDVRMGYCHGESEQVAFLAFSRPADTDEEIYKGYLSIDGIRHDVVRGSRRVKHVAGRLSDIAFELEDEAGRRLAGHGTPLNRFSYTPYPKLLSHHYLMRWELPCGPVFGEEQDLWSVPLWRQSRIAAGVVR
ncbi:hypothetical protein NT2_22_00060 [Caenibius tardaugens NBRC 16725]|uniref:DUF7065 domain-containing protein n=2 Tax=Caenibius TaxID=2827482 RepID=U2YQZ5_9SPHN|nr:hypothetical protein EGO55_04150 [Caenibius tardaugens NBRC 16725]GAD51142.1 hypothetical protein NT2_22_00060 [Caenibius tardaugens NBRC 16725]